MEAAEVEEFTADDVALLVEALDEGAREAFRGMCHDLTRIEGCRARMLHDRAEMSLYVKMDLVGQIHGVRLAMCRLLGIPVAEAEHEAAVDTYMRGVWEADGWRAFEPEDGPGAGADPDAAVVLASLRGGSRDEVVDRVISFLNEIGRPLTGERTEHERGVMYAARRIGEEFGRVPGPGRVS